MFVLQIFWFSAAPLDKPKNRGPDEQVTGLFTASGLCPRANSRCGEQVLVRNREHLFRKSVAVGRSSGSRLLGLDWGLVQHRCVSGCCCLISARPTRQARRVHDAPALWRFDAYGTQSRRFGFEGHFDH